MTVANSIPTDAVLVAIDIAKVRNEVLIEAPDLRVTHQFVSEMLGVQRSYTSRVLSALEEGGAVETGRGHIRIRDRTALSLRACECYTKLREHFDRLLPGVLA